MIKNGKYFLLPQNNADGFKEIFSWIVAAGVGRPVGKDGFPDGPWTPDLLAKAISELESQDTGIELRTVQMWFQDNDRGISTDNIRALARIFGCDDPVGTGEWQKVLMAAQTRLRKERRTKRKQSKPDDQPTADEADSTRDAENSKTPNEPVNPIFESEQATGFKLARRSEVLFANQYPLMLPSVLWAGFTVLAFVTYVIGIENVTYNPVEGLNKQVGFLWAPSWNIAPVVIMPLLLTFVIKLMTFWKEQARPELLFANTGFDNSRKTWSQKIQSYSVLFWIIFILSFGVIFLLQWSGVHLRALLQGDTSNYMIDWNNVAILRPDIISIPEAIVVSLIAYFYYGMLMWFLFLGLLLLFIIVNDFHEICSAQKLQLSAKHNDKVYNAAMAIIRETFRCTVLIVLFCTFLRLQPTFLVSNGENILLWLIQDASASIGLRTSESFWLEQRAIPHTTSVLLLSLTCFVFFTCIVQIRSVLLRIPPPTAADAAVGKQQVHVTNALPRLSLLCMIGVIVLLVLNLLAIGRIQGFSLLLATSLLVGSYSIYDPMFGRFSRNKNDLEGSIVK
ncbi:RcgA family putative transporter [Parasulfitobacter algicola]|uniref:Transmembrane protein n=1 Tax=Parasulfitobacter algicola TaxID=2614809 RepID=A0ABX2J0V8_9RHOB|nr:hypothetical protein [Sulfitobacter algicola]NSX56788.1 hypothetical protein [Sulfitobacter algicola]